MKDKMSVVGRIWPQKMLKSSPLEPVNRLPCTEKGRRQWYPTPVLLPGESHRRRSLVGCSPWGHEESDTTEWLHFHFSLSCIGEGNGNPLQCSCLENPRDRGAWRATVHRVTKSWKCRSTQSRNVCSRPNSTVLVLYSYEMYRVFFILSLPLIMHHFLMNLSSAHRCRENEEHCLMPGIQEPHQHFLWAPSLRTGVID